MVSEMMGKTLPNTLFLWMRREVLAQPWDCRHITSAVVGRAQFHFL